MESIEEKVSRLSEKLDTQFPELDLLYNITKDMGPHQNTLRIIAGDVPGEVIEIDLTQHNSDTMLTEAIFSVKELFQLFDD